MHWDGIKVRLQSYRNAKNLLTDIKTFSQNTIYSAFDIPFSQRVTCSVCGWHGFQFRSLSFGGWQSANELCPRCHSYPRQRVLADYLKEQKWQGTSGVLLDIGAGASFAPLFTDQPLRYFKGDIAKETDVTQVFDVQAMPYRDSSLDYLICLHVLDHVPDDLLAMNEIERVLKPGGTCILQGRVTQGLSETVSYFPNRSPHHPLQYRDYGRDYAQRLSTPRLKLSPLDLSNEVFYMATKEGN